jgi:von Willebrand factor type A domain
MTLRSLVLTTALALAGCHHGKAAPDGGAPDQGFVATTYDLGCASSTAKAELVPVELVVLLDRSGSMGDGVNGDPTLKWDPVTAGLEAFFAAADSAGVSASLHLFPAAADECNPSAYYAAAVPMQALPDATTYAAAISAAGAPAGDTPTRPTILGAIDYANDSATAGARSAIVLVTDGDPDACDSSVSNVSLEVAKVAATIPTYVIGVGSDLSSLDMIAQSGGTTAPTLVSVGDADQTKSDFLAALEQIRGLVLSCDFAIPAPPAGQMLDYKGVNVLFTPSSGPAEQLLYDSACSTGVGWRYDDPTAPTKIELCPDSCTGVRKDHGGRMDVIFGCATAGNLIT